MDRPKSVYNLFLLFYALELFCKIKMKQSSVILVAGFVVQIFLHNIHFFFNQQSSDFLF